MSIHGGGSTFRKSERKYFMDDPKSEISGTGALKGVAVPDYD